MERERACTNPVPLGRGKDCSVLGPMSDSKPCIIKECPGKQKYYQLDTKYST